MHELYLEGISTYNIGKKYNVSASWVANRIRSVGGVLRKQNGPRIQSEKERKCSQCKKVKSIDEFNNHKGNPLNKSYLCRPCATANQKRIKFGITVQEYNKLLKKQKGVCAICSKPERVVSKGKLKSLAVDHSHKDKKVRGLLCSACNLGIGCFDDNIEKLELAIKYLNRKRCYDG